MNSSFLENLSAEAKQRLTLSEIEGLTLIFQQYEKDGAIASAGFPAVVDALGERFGSIDAFRGAFSSFKKGSLQFADLANIYLAASITKKKTITQRGTGDSIHSFSEEEKQGYVDYINSVLTGDATLENVIPVNPHNADIFNVIGQGVLLCKLINRGFPSAVNDARIRLRPSNDYQKNENHDLCIQGARDIGCSVVNIGGKDLLEGTPHLVLGLIWQIIKKSLLAQVAANLLAEGSATDLPPEQILFRWFNYHLANAGSTRTVSNWSADLKDSELYALLLGQLEPSVINKGDIARVIEEDDFLERAENVLGYADRIGCRKFVTPREIVNGNPRLNLAFVATLFNKYPRMGPTAEEQRLSRLESELLHARGLSESALKERDSMYAQLRAQSEELDRKNRELDDVSVKLHDALASRDQLQLLNTRLEALLDERAQENARLLRDIDALASERDRLQGLIEEERDHHERTRLALSEMERRLAAAQAEAREMERSLRAQLEEERRLREEKEAALRRAEEELERVKRQAAARESELEALLKAERDKNAALEAQVAALQKENEELKNKLRDEQQLRANLEEELRETEDELEEVKAEADEEKTLLLQRIKDLEEELEQLKSLMESSLDKAARDKAEALMVAARAKEQALSEAEQARLAQMRKVQGLLAKVQRQGLLLLEEKTVLGIKWKKRHFVLQDVFLSYYRDKKAFANAKPMGIIQCDQARVYEMDAKEAKKQFQFQLDTGKNCYNLSASSLDEMKNWTKDIKEAKKKAMGVGVVAHGDIGVPASPRGGEQST